MGTAPSCRRGWGQNAAQLLFLRCLHPENSDHRFPLFLITTKSCPPKNCCSTLLFAAVYNKLAGGAGGCCVSPSQHPAHLTPAFCMFVFCLLFFLNLPSLPVRFLGWACTGCKRWCPNKDITMGDLEAGDEKTISEKHAHNRKYIRWGGEWDGESELNTIRCKNMGQYESKDWELHIQALKGMLKIRGSRVRLLQLMQFLDFVQDTCPWFPEEGNENLETWNKIGDGLRARYMAEGHACPFLLLVCGLWLDCLEPTSSHEQRFSSLVSELGCGTHPLQPVIQECER
jgi:hypothetical protein